MASQKTPLFLGEGTAVVFSHWYDQRREERERSLGMITDAEYRPQGYIRIQRLSDLAMHTFYLDDKGDVRDGEMPLDGKHTVPYIADDEMFLITLRFMQGWTGPLRRSRLHPLLLQYVERIGCAHYLRDA